jgi:large subunit ribosomal protein L4
MASLDVVDSDGKTKEKVNISDEMINQKVNSEILYQEIRRYLAAVRSGTHKTKNRGEVSGGGKKPWRQKGTGNARAGSNRSPIWKGGGIIFGPVPRDYGFKLNKKVMKQSKLIAFSDKFKNKKIIVVDKLDFKKPETKKAAAILKKLKLDSEKVLVVFENLNTDEVKSFRNISNVMVESSKGLNAYIILVADYLIFTKSSLDSFIERTKNGRR